MRPAARAETWSAQGDGARDAVNLAVADASQGLLERGVRPRAKEGGAIGHAQDPRRQGGIAFEQVGHFPQVRGRIAHQPRDARRLRAGGA